MEKAAIFGAAGAVGTLVGQELATRGVPFRVVGRARARLEQTFGNLPGAEILEADLADPRSATQAASGIELVFYTVGVPYAAFEQHPRLMRTTIDAARSTGVSRMLIVSSVYSYGVPETRKVPETHPRHPVAKKGEMRKQQEDIALEAHGSEGLLTTVVRLPDFYGPYARQSLAHMIFEAALQDKTANWLGPASTPHEFIFVPDAAPVLVDLAASDENYGQAWNLAGSGEITGADFIQKIYLAARRRPRYRTVGRTMLRLAGFFNPLMREFPEMLYLTETPVLLDDSKLIARLGRVHKTPYDEAIRKTLDWMRADSQELTNLH